MAPQSVQWVNQLAKKDLDLWRKAANCLRLLEIGFFGGVDACESAGRALLAI